MSTYKRSNMTEAPEQYDNCPDFLERYLNYLAAFSNKKPSTVIEYCTTLREYFQYIHYKKRFLETPRTKDAHKDLDITRIDLNEVCAFTQDDVEEYLVFLDTVVQNKSQTVRKKLGLIREFYSYVESNSDDLGVSLPKGNPARFIPNPKVPKSDVKPMTFLQVKRLMSYTFGETALRDEVIILLISTTALTLSEVVSLNRSDLKDGYLTLHPSGEEDRVVPLTPSCETQLREYLAQSENHFEGDSAMFKSADGKSRLTPRAIQFRISKTAVRAGMSDRNINAQTLRDTGAAFILSSTPALERQQMLYYLGYHSKHAIKRFSWLFPKKPEDQMLMMNAVRKNAKLLAVLGETQETAEAM